MKVQTERELTDCDDNRCRRNILLTTTHAEKFMYSARPKPTKRNPNFTPSISDQSRGESKKDVRKEMIKQLATRRYTCMAVAGSTFHWLTRPDINSARLRYANGRTPFLHNRSRAFISDAKSAVCLPTLVPPIVSWTETG